MAERIRTAQANFNSGEIDPLLIERDDIKYFFSAADKMRNVVCLPQGGFRRRPGLRYMAEVRPQVARISSGITATAPNGGTAANGNDVNDATEVLSTVNISTTNNYVLIHYDLGSAKTILFADVTNFRLTVSDGTDGEWVVQYSTDNVVWNLFGKPGLYAPATVLGRTRRFSDVSPGSVSARYWRFVRVGATDLGTNKAALAEFHLWESLGTISNVRYINFTFSQDQQYLLILTNYNMAVYKDNAFECDIRVFGATNDKVRKFNWVQSLDTLLLFEQDTLTRKIIRQGADDQWQSEDVAWSRQPTYQWDNPDTTGTGTPAAVSGTGVNFTSSTSYFTAGMVGKYIRGGGGFALISAYTSATVVQIDIIEPYRFDSTDPIGPGDWVVEEDVWSATHGYPTCGVFHEGRLWLGGSRELPMTLWGSKTGRFFDFGSGTGLADEAIDVTLDSNGLSAIYQLYSGRNLSIFTQDSEWYVPAAFQEPITPSNITLRRVTSRGIKQYVPVVEMTGAILFVQRLGKTIREFIWNETEVSYNANPLSLLASHLLNDPVDMRARPSTSTDEADYVLIVNSDGALTMLTTLREQNITAFTQVSTKGDFKACAVVGDVMYFAVRRTVGGFDRLMLERFDNALYLDCALSANRPSHDVYTATAAQTNFAFTHAVTTAAELSVTQTYAATGASAMLMYGVDYTATGIPGTGDIVLAVGASAGDIITITYPTDTFGGMGYLEDEDVRAVTDGNATASVTVSGGLAVFADAWETEAQCGLDFPDVTGRGLNEGVQVKTLPPSPQLQIGSHKGLRRRVMKVHVAVRDTKHFNLYRLGSTYAPEFRDMDAEILDNAPVSFTGVKRIEGLLGWDEFGQFEITQSEPQPLTVLAVTAEVAI